MSGARGEEAPAGRYRRGLESGRLVFQHCERCSSAVFYPRVLCPVCGGDLVGRESGGRGTVYATTTVHRREGLPYDVSLIDLDEGFRMMSRVEGVDPEEVAVGMSVTLRVRTEDAEPVAVFVPGVDGGGG